MVQCFNKLCVQRTAVHDMFNLKYLTVVCLVFAFLPVIISQCSVNTAQKTLKRSVYEFSVDLMTKLSQDNEHHFVASPLSLWSVLSLISLGATGQTLAELKDILKLHRNRCFNRKYLEITNRACSLNETGVFLERSSVMFADEDITFVKKYENEVFDSGISHLERIQFDNADSAASTINDYVSRATKETIEEIVSPGDLEDVKMVIVDALFFKGLWQIPFKTSETEIGEFYDNNGKKTGDVNIMAAYDSFNIANIDHIQAQVLELPYGDGKRHSMLLFLPFEHVSLYSVIENLKTITLATIKTYFNRFEPPTVVVRLPRFKITSDLNNLKDLLIDMNLRTMFDSSQANLSSMTHMSLHVSNVVQKVDIELTEDGSTVSAASLAGMGFRSGPQEFFATKPFLFMIIDKEYEIPIFSGAYSKPSVY